MQGSGRGQVEKGHHASIQGGHAEAGSKSADLVPSLLHCCSHQLHCCSHQLHLTMKGLNELGARVANAAANAAEVAAV